MIPCCSRTGENVHFGKVNCNMNIEVKLECCFIIYGFKHLVFVFLSMYC